MAWYLGGLTWKELAKRTVHQTLEDKVVDQAAGLAFYFLLALFPLLIFLISILGLVASHSGLEQHLIHRLTQAMPPGASGLVGRVVRRTTEVSGSGTLSFGIVFALWTASSGMVALITSLNRAFDVRGERSWIHQRFTALWLTCAMSLFMLVSIAIVLFGSRIESWLAGGIGMGAFFGTLWRVVQWPIAVVLVIIAFEIVYRYAPNRQEQSWKWLTPGAVIGVLLWLAASLGFRYYLAHFGNYTSTYGSLGAVIVLMLWFYITAIAILVGAEVDSAIEAAHRRRLDAANRPQVRERQAGAA